MCCPEPVHILQIGLLLAASQRAQHVREVEREVVHDCVAIWQMNEGTLCTGEKVCIHTRNSLLYLLGRQISNPVVLLLLFCYRLMRPKK
jgi:hypothetical protein